MFNDIKLDHRSGASRCQHVKTHHADQHTRFFHEKVQHLYSIHAILVFAETQSENYELGLEKVGSNPTPT
jgi:hypothetical protein